MGFQSKFSWDTVCRDRSLPCSVLNWWAIPASVLNRFPIEILPIILSSRAFCLSWMTSLFGGLKWVSDIVKMQYSRNHRFGTTSFSCYGCYWPSSGQPATEGFKSLRKAHHLAKSVKTGKLGCQLNRVCQIIKEFAQGARLTPITGRYLKVFSKFDECSFSNISNKFSILCFRIYFTLVRITSNKTKQWPCNLGNCRLISNSYSPLYHRASHLNGLKKICPFLLRCYFTLSPRHF